MELVYLIVGLLVGIVLAFFYFRMKMAQDANQSVQQHPVTLELRSSVEKLQTELGQERRVKEDLMRSLSAAQANLISAADKLKEQEQNVVRIREEFTKEFENLANRIFDDKSKKVTEQNKSQLDLVLNPLKEKLKDFETKVEKVYNEENKDRINLKAEIRLLSDLNKQLSTEANNLATALKGDNKSQGNWGELILEKILERSGLTEGTEFKTQETSTNSSDERIRPDVVVFLPEGKHLIIDSKVSLIAYNSMIAAATDEDRERFIKAHCESVRSHVKQLGDKNYHTARGFNSPDFVLLFMPIEAAFATALQADSDLYNLAWDRKIVIVSPTTLLATLRTVSSLWMQEKRNRNAEAIAEEAGKLYDKFQGFTEDLIKVGIDIKRTQDNYSEAMKKLTDGRGNLISKVEKIKDLGANTNKQINQKLLDRSMGES
jgi:DNA recombination protein RmuC